MIKDRFRANYNVSIYDAEREEYIPVDEKGLQEIAKIMNKQKNIIEQKDKELCRLYNYFEDYLKYEMSPEAFSEMWDDVKKDERWEI